MILSRPLDRAQRKGNRRSTSWCSAPPLVAAAGRRWNCQQKWHTGYPGQWWASGGLSPRGSGWGGPGRFLYQKAVKRVNGHKVLNACSCCSWLQEGCWWREKYKKWRGYDGSDGKVGCLMWWKWKLSDKNMITKFVNGSAQVRVLSLSQSIFNPFCV